MNTESPDSTRQIVWPNIIFFAVTTLLAVIGGPIYIARYGIAPVEIALFLFFTAATGLGITVGYHRLFAHSTYKAHPLVQFLLLFFGAAAFEQSALVWSSQHRDHHLYVDTDKDPYDIKKGFFYAHIGWLIFWVHKKNRNNVKDLEKNALVMHQYRNYNFWAVGAGILLPVALGALTGHALGALIFGVAARLTFVYHATFCINSVCHMFGKSTYDIHATAKDHWFVALLTYGEGYHNFHHRFPSDYRNGVRWYQWDPSKWMIAALQKVRLVHDLRRVSRFRILEARLAADRQRAQEYLKVFAAPPFLLRLQENLEARYASLRQYLHHWEESVKNLHLEKGAMIRVKAARIRFQKAHRQWELIHQSPPRLKESLLFAV